MDVGKLSQSTKQAEGCRLRAYQDSKGVWTIGWGRNLQTMRVSQELADTWFNEDLKNAVTSAQMFPEFKYLDTDARQNAFAEMVYNLGSFKVSGFRNMLEAIQHQDWPEVKRQALDSDWHKQVGARAERIAEMFLTGKFQE